MTGTKKQLQSIGYLKAMKDTHSPEDYNLDLFKIYWGDVSVVVERQISRKDRDTSNQLVAYLNQKWNLFRVGPRGGITELH